MIKKWISTPLGNVLLTGEGRALAGLWFERQRYFAPGVELDGGAGELPVFDAVEEWLARYFAGRDPGPAPPLAPAGSEFRRLVLDELQKVPYGATITYTQLADRVAAVCGKRAAPRAVGGAVGHNPISILIPCHRVLGSDGSLTGYAGGLERKKKLLILEKALILSDGGL